MNNNEIQKRKSPRLSGFDYSSSRCYFITICTYNQKCTLGRIICDKDNGHIQFSGQGKTVDSHIRALSSRYEKVRICNYTIMPNHVHLLIEIENNANVSIPDIISFFKAGVTREVGTTVWQRSYYDHIVRSEKDYRSIWLYIDNNPARWAMDKYYRV